MLDQTLLTQIRQKALKVNLDPIRYGSFAEIGAGQEVVRWFFQAGGAAGTIAKSISAYDMKVSDAIYGTCARYVCRERLESMLVYEQDLNLKRLSEQRGEDTAFFAFADTVSARNFHGTNECHGWMGIRFQEKAGEADSQIIIHVSMLDNENGLQQEALGMVGVNLVYGASFLASDPQELIHSLLDGVGVERLQIDMIEFSGPAFEDIDNRVMTLHLVQLGLTGAAMFGADGSVLQPQEYFRKKPILVQRGRFRPITHVNLDMMDSALDAFSEKENVKREAIVPVLEMTMHNLKVENEEVNLKDFISRAEIIAATGYAVLVTDFARFDPLAEFLGRCTSNKIGIALGLPSLIELFDERYYEDMRGGILESFGHLFKKDLNLYVYPMKDQETGEIVTVDSLTFDQPLQQLFEYLHATDCIVALRETQNSHLDIFSPKVLEKIAMGDQNWQEMVPPEVAQVIKDSCLFGYCEIFPQESDVEPSS